MGARTGDTRVLRRTNTKGVVSLLLILLAGGTAQADAPTTAPPAPAPSSGSQPPPAAPTPTAAPAGLARIFGGHRFVAFRGVAWPFVTSRVLSGISAGASHPDLDGAGGAPRASLTTLEAALRGEAAILSWLGLEVDVTAAMALGQDARAVTAIGASASYGGGLFAVLDLIRTRRVLLGVRVDLRFGRVQAIVPARLLDSARVEGGDVTYDFDRLTASALALHLVPQLVSALALSRYFGVQASAGLDAGYLHGDVARSWQATASAAVGLSLYLRWVSLLVGGRIARDLDGGPRDFALSMVQAAARTRGQLEGALYYTARPELDLGLAVNASVADADRRVLATASLGYYF